MTMEEESEDSLDLLLDTLCNAFGAIILITLLITILSQEANSNILPVKNFKNQWLLEKQMISKIKKDLLAEELIGPKIPEDEKKVHDQSIIDAIQKMKSLELEKDQVIEEIKLGKLRMRSMPYDSTNLAENLDHQYSELRLIDQNMVQEIELLKKHVIEKETEHLSIKKEWESSKKKRTQTLRLPQEKGGSEKQFLWIIVKYGKIYPCYHSNKEQIFDITQSREFVSGNFIFWHKPKPGFGFDVDLDRSDIIEYFKSVQKRTEYLAFEVFPNDLSFRAFNEAKNLATSMGIGYTWAPRKDDIGLTKNGKGAGREL